MFTYWCRSFAMIMFLDCRLSLCTWRLPRTTAHFGPCKHPVWAWLLWCSGPSTWHCFWCLSFLHFAAGLLRRCLAVPTLSRPLTLYWQRRMSRRFDGPQVSVTWRWTRVLYLTWVSGPSSWHAWELLFPGWYKSVSGGVHVRCISLVMTLLTAVDCPICNHWKVWNIGQTILYDDDIEMICIAYVLGKLTGGF